MSFLLACMLQVAAATTPSSELIAPVPGTRLFARLSAPGFAKEGRHVQALTKALGPRGIFVGMFPEEKASMELVIEKEPEKQPHMTDAEWRDFNLKDAGASWKYFEAEGLLCGEASLYFEGSGSHDFHAFAVRAGHRIDLHLVENWDAKKEKPRLTRARFIELAASFRLGIVRFGTWADLPPRAIELMDQAFQREETWEAHFAELAKASPDDYAIPFATAEVARFLGQPKAEQVDAYSKAIELLAAKKEPTAHDRFAHVASEHGLATLCIEAGEMEKGITHLEAAQGISAGLRAGVRAAVLYDRARAEARLGRPEAALDRLREAQALEPGAIQRAIHEKDLECVRELPWFKNFLAGDRDNR